MKKFLSSTIIIVLALVMTACAKQNPDNTIEEGQPSVDISEDTTEVTEDPTEALYQQILEEYNNGEYIAAYFDATSSSVIMRYKDIDEITEKIISDGKEQFVNEFMTQYEMGNFDDALALAKTIEVGIDIDEETYQFCEKIANMQGTFIKYLTSTSDGEKIYDTVVIDGWNIDYLGTQYTLTPEVYMTSYLPSEYSSYNEFITPHNEQIFTFDDGKYGIYIDAYYRGKIYIEEIIDGKYTGRLGVQYKDAEAVAFTENLENTPTTTEHVTTEHAKDPQIGMTQSEVLASSWGSPKRKNKTTYAWGESEQWVYDNGYIYFDDGIVTSIQEIDY